MDDPQSLLDAAGEAQTAYWNALRALEVALDIEIDNSGSLELTGLTVDELKEFVRTEGED